MELMEKVNIEDEMEIKGKLTDQVIDILKRYDHKYDSAYKLVKNHLTAKKEINDLLGLNFENDYRLIFEMESDEQDILNNYPILKDVNKIIKFDVKYSDEKQGFTIDYKENKIHYYKDTEFGRKKYNQNLTKFLNIPEVKEVILPIVDYICKEMGINIFKLDNTKKSDETLFNAFITKIGEIGNVKGITKRKLIVSSNISDMLTASTNSEFHSCYTLERDDDDDNSPGCHVAGINQYITDKYSIIAFVAENGNFERKIGRSMVYLNPENRYKQFLIGREYGNFSNNIKELLGKNLSQILDNGKLFSENWNKEDVTIGEEIYKPSNIGGSGRNNGPGYFDPYMVNWYINGFNSKFEMEFPDSICIECGRSNHDNNNELTCDHCTDSKYSCSCCGCRIDRDEMMTNDYGDEFCSECYYDRYNSCTCCGSEIRNNDIYEFQGEFYCQSCFDDRFNSCCQCDQTERIEDLIEFEDELFCQSCYDSKMEEQEEKEDE